MRETATKASIYTRNCCVFWQNIRSAVVSHQRDLETSWTCPTLKLFRKVMDSLSTIKGAYVFESGKNVSNQKFWEGVIVTGIGRELLCLIVTIFYTVNFFLVGRDFFRDRWNSFLFCFVVHRFVRETSSLLYIYI